jgi:hypothetical protein
MPDSRERQRQCEYDSPRTRRRWGENSFSVSDTRFYFSFTIGVFNPARHGYNAVVRQHIPKKWVESGIVDIRNDDSFAQIVENYQTRTTRLVKKPVGSAAPRTNLTSSAGS